MVQQIVLAITPASPSDRRCCSWRTFPITTFIGKVRQEHNCGLLACVPMGGGGHCPTNCVVITTMSPSDRRCCSCRTFPDNNLYRGKCARRRIVDRWPGSPLQGVGQKGGGGLAWGWAMGGRASVVWTSLVVTVVGVVSLSSTWRFVAASSVRGSEVAHQDLPTLAPPPLTLPPPHPPHLPEHFPDSLPLPSPC